MMLRTPSALGALLILLTSRVLAQGDCFPPDDSNEAQLFAAFSVPLAFGPMESPGVSPPGAFRVGLEATYLPNIDEEIRTPTICRPGKGPENTDLLFAFARPRAALGLPGGLALEASWIPPLRVNQVRANLVGVALERGFPVGAGNTRLAFRLHGTLGLVRAPITCDDDALEDENSECFQGTRSDDKYHPNIFGLEGSLGWSLGPGRVRPFVGTGVNLLRPRFQVNFTNQFGQLDNRRVEVDLTRVVLFAGASWAAGPRLGLAGSLYASPGDAVTGRVMASYRMR
jgi:hypothetical protein